MKTVTHVRFVESVQIGQRLESVLTSQPGVPGYVDGLIMKEGPDGCIWIKAPALKGITRKVGPANLKFWDVLDEEPAKEAPAKAKK